MTIPITMKNPVSGLNSPTRVAAFEAAKALWAQPDLSLERHLIRLLKEGRRPFNRAAAAYAMQSVTTPRTVAALEATVSDTAESPSVRAEAAEALAHAHRRKTHAVLL